MSENTRELVGVEAAQKIVGKQLWYWISQGRGPKFETIAGRKIFDKQDLLSWKPLKHPPGRRKDA